MLEHQLREELSRVRLRLGRLWLWRKLTWCWIGFGALLASWWAFGQPLSVAPAMIIGASWLTATLLWVKSKRLPLSKTSVARYVEQAFPELNSRLLAALEQAPDVQTGRWNVLQRQIVAEALHHSRINDWADAVPPKRMKNAFLSQSASLLAFVAICLALIPSTAQKIEAVAEVSQPAQAVSGDVMPVIEPGDAELERGSSLLVLARFGGSLPANVTLTWRDDAPSADVDSQEQRLPLTKSLDDPVFGGRMPSIKNSLRYWVEFDDKRTREYKVAVYDLPALVRSDLEITYPSYTGLGIKKLEDAFDAVVVEGTTIRVACRVNKSLKSARLIEDGISSIDLVPDPANPLIYQADFTPTKRHRMKLVLTDDAGRVNRDSEEFRFEATPNRPPELKLAFPGQDVKVSPIEEVLVEANASDDFGLVETGLIVNIPGREPIEISLSKAGPAPQEKSQQRLKEKLSHLQRLEELKVEPNELISYYLFADDHGPDGERRRTTSDMFFAEVRPFEEIFRQLESPPGGQSQASGSQQQEGNPLTKLAELQKQIVVATWNLVRSTNAASAKNKWNDKVAEQVLTIQQSQQKAIEQLESLAERLTNPKQQPTLELIAEKMAAANRSLGRTLSESSPKSLAEATSAEQAAYQGLLKLRATEHLIMQGSQSASGSSGNASPSEQQLQQLELDNKQNRYEAQRSAQQQQTGQQQQEELAMFDRLKELATRQQFANEKLRELEAALRTVKTEAEKEELERQLKHLRDEQQQLLHDADELRNRMAQSTQQEKLSDTRQQLEQTRKQMVEAAEKLREGQLSQALSAGTRAERELNQLQEDFRKQTAAKFADAMRSLRDGARQLAENEKQLSDRLSALQDESSRSLRQSKDRQNLEAEFKQQRQLANDLVDAAKNVVEQSETAEPLLSKQLYDTVRSTREMKTDQALDATSQLLRAGFVTEAQKAEQQARAGIDRFRQGVESAAEGILGDEVESLKRARRELSDLAEQLDKEIAMQTKRSGSGGKQSEEGQPGEGDGQTAKPGEAGTNDPKSANGQSASNGEKSAPGEGGSGKEPASTKEGQSSEGEGNSPGDSQNQKAQGKKGQQPQGQGAAPGEGQTGQSPDGKGPSQRGQPSANGQPGQGGSSGQGEGGQGESPGDQPQGDQPSNRPGRTGLRGQQPSGGSPRPGSGKSNGNSEQSGSGGGPGSQGGPLTGDNFSEWNERLRDVESMVSDPKLQADVAKIRERARSVRADFKRHSKDPNWDLVRSTVREPISELQQRLAEEISKRESPDSLVPVDRDPVPTRYRDLVRSYYERLGSGKPSSQKTDPQSSK